MVHFLWSVDVGVGEGHAQRSQGLVPRWGPQGGGGQGGGLPAAPEAQRARGEVLLLGPLQPGGPDAHEELPSEELPSEELPSEELSRR